jgi:2-iminobutanoate/2-iminopropanoate deaminase
MNVEGVTSPKLPEPIGPYSPAVKVTAGSTVVYVAGMTALNAAKQIVGDGDVRSQTRQVIENIRHALEAAGGTLANVVRTTVYLVDIAKFGDVNSVYAEYFKEPYPARVVLQAAALPRKEFLVEIDAIAVLA